MKTDDKMRDLFKPKYKSVLKSITKSKFEVSKKVKLKDSDENVICKTIIVIKCEKTYISKNSIRKAIEIIWFVNGMLHEGYL